MRSISTIVLLAWVLGTTGLARAREFFVEQKHSQAGDKNDGSEARPLKTIQAAVDLAKPGDMIWIKAGTYEEPVKIAKSGTLAHPITISAWRDDRVCVGSIPRDLPPAGEWKAVPNSRSWSVQLPEGTPDDLIVILDGKPIVTQRKDTPPDEKDTMWATYRKLDRTLMVVAEGKDNPAAAHKLQLARQFQAFMFTEDSSFWALKKLEIAYVSDGVATVGAGYLIEDCYFHNTYRNGIFPHGRLTTIRRCNFHKCGYAITASGSGPANIIEDNLVVECGQEGDDDILHHSMHLQEGLGPLTFKGDAFGQVFRYNIVADNLGGLWYDGNAVGCRVIGNCFWDNRYGNGLYNEYCANDTMVMGNYWLHTNVTSSWCTRLNVVENFFDGGCVVWHCRLLWPLRNSFMTMRGNALVDPPGGYLQHYGFGWGKSPYPEGFSRCWADYNRIRLRAEYPLINDAGNKVESLAEVRSKYGWEIHGECKAYDPDRNDLTPESMGGSTATFRLPWGPKSFLARPMLSDSGVNGTFPAAAETYTTYASPSFFWRVADGNYDDRVLWPFEDWFEHHARFAPVSTAGYGQGENHGARWFIDAEKKSAEKLEPKDIWPEMSNGNHWLRMEGVSPEKMPAQGVGYWSPPLAAIEGAKITVSLRMMGQDIQPTDRGTPAVWLQFTDETGQNRKRVFLVGKDDDGTVVRERLTKGGYDWTVVKDTITAPKGAIRMALFLGVLPCKGVVCFDDIDIKTATASSPAALAQAEALPPRLRLERIKKTFPIDLSTLTNRGLADDVANDGQGGWSDQGALADMRALKTGKVKYGGVPFEIGAEPKCCVVLKSSSRNAGQLPARVTIPVGKRLDTLFFLHASAWAQQGGDLNFQYVIHYRDQKDVTLLVTGNNLADWTADPVRRFPKEENTFTTAAVTVPVPQFGQGTVYRMEWNAPAHRRAVEIESIEFIGGGKAVPILLGITGATEW
jgi:hypothetical protein